MPWFPSGEAFGKARRMYWSPLASNASVWTLEVRSLAFRHEGWVRCTMYGPPEILFKNALSFSFSFVIQDRSS